MLVVSAVVAEPSMGAARRGEAGRVPGACLVVCCLVALVSPAVLLLNHPACGHRACEDAGGGLVGREEEERALWSFVIVAVVSVCPRSGFVCVLLLLLLSVCMCGLHGELPQPLPQKPWRG